MDPDPPAASNVVVVDALVTVQVVGGVVVLGVVELLPQAAANNNANIERAAHIGPGKRLVTIMNSSCAGRRQPEIRP